MGPSPPEPNSRSSTESKTLSSPQAAPKQRLQRTRTAPSRTTPHQGRHGLARAMLVYGTEDHIAAPTRPSFDSIMQNTNSCPELGVVKNPKLTPPSVTRSSLDRRSPLSQPPTPTSLRSRLASALRFRRPRPWSSSTGSSRSSFPTSSPDPESEPKYPNGKERRRQARDSEQHRCSSENTTPRSSGAVEEEGTRELAMAGAMLAASELDRLSLMAREGQGSKGAGQLGEP